MIDGDQLDLKQDHATQKRSCPLLLEQQPSLMPLRKKLAKWRRSHSYRREVSKLRQYLNYKGSGMLERILFYQNGEWINFPQDFIDLVKNELMLKKTIIEVPFNGHNLVINFLHLYQVDLKTGLQQPIGWIDSLGMCFFPEVSFASDKESHDLCKQKDGDVHKTHGYDDIKLHLGIKVDGLDEPKLKECYEDSNVLTKHIQIDVKIKFGQYNVKIEDNGNKIDERKASEELNQEQDLDIFTKHVNEKMDLDIVKKMFVEGMGNFGTFDIVEIFQFSNSSLQDRLEVFEKQVEITKKHHGKANLHYAWLASSKRDLSTMVEYGVGYCEVSRTSTYGTGVHLSSTSYAYNRLSFLITTRAPSVNFCDVDENGLRHLVLCRVILGSLELLHPGNKQIHPSSYEYDNGIGDVHPRHYIVWNMNANTHIYPEFVVSFKISSEFEDYLDVMEKMQSASRLVAKTYQDPMGLIHLKASFDVLESAHISKLATNDPGDPNSYWFFLPLLVEVLKNRVSSRNKVHVDEYYKEFMSNRISREELMNKLREVVGDGLLKRSFKFLHIDESEAFRNNPNPRENENNH